MLQGNLKNGGMSYDDERPMVGNSYRPKSRRCCVVSVLSVALALILILAIAIPVGIKNSRSEELKGAEAVGPACDATSYPDQCRASLAGSDGTPRGMSKMMLEESDSNLAHIQNSTVDEQCKALFATARQSVMQVFITTENGTDAERTAACQDMQTHLSAAIEQVTTCGMVLEELQSPELASFGVLSQNATTSLSIVLSFMNCFCTYGNNLKAWKQMVPDGFQDIVNQFAGAHRRLLDAEDLEDESRESSYMSEEVYPSWMDSATSRHLLATPAAYNVIVAKDGSGKYKTVMDAIQNAPSHGDPAAPRYIIYVKKGVYNEQITVPSDMTNLMIVGDGIDRTIFTGNKNVALMKGMTTFASATLSESHSQTHHLYCRVSSFDSSIVFFCSEIVSCCT